MQVKDDLYTIQISEVYDTGQEDFVIEKIKGYLKKDTAELKSHFKETDTVVVKKLSKDDANSLAKELETIDVKVEILGGKPKKKQEDKKEIRCPKCGAKLEYQDWRCPEFYYEFPDYEYLDETSEDETS
jgi:protein-arginine kinase activator protein McsA